MKPLLSRRGPLLGLLAALLLAAMPLSGARAADCSDLEDRGYAQILTLNLLFSEVEQRDARFQAIAGFLDGLDEPVDFILLQEVVGGALVGTDNSAADLRAVLEATTGEDYELRTAFEAGLPGVLATGYMVGLLEWTCIQLLQPHLDDGEGSLGIHVDVSHQAATPPGLTVTTDVEVAEVKGPRVAFQVRAHDGIDLIGEGRHERFVVKWDRFNARVEAKRAEALA